jgi:pre-mRNA-splicing factor SYF1
MRYAALEVRMGEIDRARAVFAHGAQVAEPRMFAEFWAAWQEFEVRHGNDDTFRDMLRIKRTVQTQLAQVRTRRPSEGGRVV